MAINIDLGSKVVEFARQVRQDDFQNAMAAAAANLRARQQAASEGQHAASLGMRAQEDAARNQMQQFGAMADLYKFNTGIGFQAWNARRQDELARYGIDQRQEGYQSLRDSREAIAGDRILLGQQRMAQDAQIAQQRMDQQAALQIDRMGGVPAKHLRQLGDEETQLRLWAQQNGNHPSIMPGVMGRLQQIQEARQALYQQAREQGQEDPQAAMQREIKNRIVVIGDADQGTESAFYMDQHGIPKQHFRYALEDPKHWQSTLKDLLPAFTTEEVGKDGIKSKKFDLEGMSQFMRKMEDEQRIDAGLKPRYFRQEQVDAERARAGKQPVIEMPFGFQVPGPKPPAAVVPSNWDRRGGVRGKNGRAAGSVADYINPVTGDVRGRIDNGGSPEGNGDVEYRGGVPIGRSSGLVPLESRTPPEWADTREKQGAHQTVVTLKEKVASGEASASERQQYIEALRVLGIIK